MKQKPRWTLEMLTASLAVLCGLLVLVLLPEPQPVRLAPLHIELQQVQQLVPHD